MFHIPIISHGSRAPPDASGMMHLNALNGSLDDREESPPRSVSRCLPSYEEAVTNASPFGLFSVGGGDAIHVHHNTHHDCHNLQQHQQDSGYVLGGQSHSGSAFANTPSCNNTASMGSNCGGQVQQPQSQSHSRLSGRCSALRSGPPSSGFRYGLRVNSGGEANGSGDNSSSGGCNSASPGTGNSKSGGCSSRGPAVAAGKRLAASWEETRFVSRDDNAAERLDKKGEEEWGGGGEEDGVVMEDEDRKKNQQQQQQCERFSRISIVSNNSSFQSFQSIPKSPRLDHKAENKMAAKSSEKSGCGTGSGSWGWRKQLTVERSPVSFAKDRLYRVFSPKPSRKHDRQSESSAKGGHGKSKVQLPKTRGNENGTELETTSHPMRMRVHSGRSSHGRAYRDDDVKPAGAKQQKQQQQQQQQQQQLKASSHAGR